MDWKQGFDWSVPLHWDAVDTLLQAQVRSAHESPAALVALSETVFRDLAAATLATAESAEQSANVDILRFLIGLPVAISALIEGDHGLAYDWVLAGISRTFEFGRHMNHGDYRLPPYEGGDPVGNIVAMANRIRWFRAFYTVAIKLGGIDELARLYAPGATALALGALGAEHRSTAVQLLALIGQWVAEHRRPQARWFARQLGAMFDAKGFTPRDRVAIGTALCGALAPYSGLPANVWARRLLDEQGDALVEHESVQLQILAIDTLEAWHAQRERLLADIAELAGYYRDVVRMVAMPALRWKRT